MSTDDLQNLPLLQLTERAWGSGSCGELAALLLTLDLLHQELPPAAYKAAEDEAWAHLRQRALEQIRRNREEEAEAYAPLRQRAQEGGE